MLRHVYMLRPGQICCNIYSGIWTAARLEDNDMSLACAGAVANFQERVSQALPGMYCFFPHDYLHITLRALG